MNAFAGIPPTFFAVDVMPHPLIDAKQVERQESFTNLERDEEQDLPTGN